MRWRVYTPTTLTCYCFSLLFQARTGFILNFVGVLTINLGINTWGVAMFDLNNFPAWANSTKKPWMWSKWWKKRGKMNNICLVIRVPPGSADVFFFYIKCSAVYSCQCSLMCTHGLSLKPDTGSLMRLSALNSLPHTVTQKTSSEQWSSFIGNVVMI